MRFIRDDAKHVGQLPTDLLPDNRRRAMLDSIILPNLRLGGASARSRTRSPPTRFVGRDAPSKVGV